jgi:hypothetical protein
LEVTLGSPELLNQKADGKVHIDVQVFILFDFIVTQVELVFLELAILFFPAPKQFDQTLRNG